MKKIFISIVALAAIAACSKTEVQYENSAEIGFAPVVKNVTKAAMTGDLLTANPDQELGIWAYWNYLDGSPTDDGHSQLYLDNVAFKGKNISYTSNNITTSGYFWAGVNYAYPWPANGTLRFAGYTIPTSAGENFEVTYSGVVGEGGDVLTFSNYVHAMGYDLCWFGATAEVNNKNVAGKAVEVTLSHALSWLSFTVKGDGTTATGWKITKIELNDIANKGTGTCSSSDVNWSSNEYSEDYTLYDDPIGIELTADAQNIELDDNGNTADEFVVLPQEINKADNEGNRVGTHSLAITYSFPVGTVWKTDKKVITLDLGAEDAEWKAGIHYTYNITLKSNEILITPTYGTWNDAQNQGVTVE